MDEVRTDPKAFLSKYPTGVIIDEEQNYPDIFPYLQVLVDDDRFYGRSDRRLINMRHQHAFQTFVRLAAGRVGQEFNASSMSVEIGVAVNTIRAWLSILEASYIVYLLHPYYANVSKRLTKTPKLYFYDTGFQHNPQPFNGFVNFREA